jgi:hypothetical protein
LISCKNNINKEESEKYTVLSVIANRFTIADLPPPKPGRGFDLSSQQLDSIRNQKQSIAVHPNLLKSNHTFNEKFLEDELFLNLLNNLKTIDDKNQIDLKKIETKIPHNLFYLDTIKNNNDKYYVDSNFDKLLIFSPVSFNEDLNKAVVIVAVKKGYMNSSSSIVLLEKKNGVWEISSVKEYLIS